MTTPFVIKEGLGEMKLRFVPSRDTLTGTIDLIKYNHRLPLDGTLNIYFNDRWHCFTIKNNIELIPI